MRFMTINQAGELPELPGAGTIRRMVKEGKCPGFRSGTRFYVDTVQLIAKIEATGPAKGGDNDD